MSIHPRFSVLVGADFRSGTCRAVVEATRLATRTGGPAALRVVYVAPIAREARTYQRVAERVPDELLLFAGTYGCRGVERHTDLLLSVHLRFGDPGDEIRTLAAEVAADAIVIGPRAGEAPEGPLADRLRADVNRPVFVAGVDSTEPLPRDVIRRPACEPCARGRRESDGVDWYCDDHRPEPGTRRSFERTLVRHWTTWEPNGGAVAAF